MSLGDTGLSTAEVLFPEWPRVTRVREADLYLLLGLLQTNERARLFYFLLFIFLSHRQGQPLLSINRMLKAGTGVL